MTDMPVISLWQPYASLIFAGAKLHETRSYAPPTKYIDCIVAIHATAKFPPLKLLSDELHELCIDTFGCSYNFTLPLGAILGTVRLRRGLPTDIVSPNVESDFIAGDWTPGRFAWPLSDVSAFATPIPAKGKQGWWKWSFPSPQETSNG